MHKHTGIQPLFARPVHYLPYMHHLGWHVHHCNLLAGTNKCRTRAAVSVPRVCRTVWHGKQLQHGQDTQQPNTRPASWTPTGGCASWTHPNPKSMLLSNHKGPPYSSSCPSCPNCNPGPAKALTQHPQPPSSRDKPKYAGSWVISSVRSKRAKTGRTGSIGPEAVLGKPTSRQACSESAGDFNPAT